MPALPPPLPVGYKRKVGRPLTYTTELAKIFCDIIRRGNYFVTACQGMGIPEQTARYWFKNSRDLGDKSPYAGFAELLTEARAEFTLTRVHNIVSIADNPYHRDQMHANQWMLTHGPDKERWAQVTEQKVTTSATLTVIPGTPAALAAMVPEDAIDRELARIDEIIEMTRVDGDTYQPA